MRQEVCEQFKELQKQYHNVIQDAPLITKIKAFIAYGCMSLNLFWRNTDNKEKFIIVSRIIDEIIYRLTQILTITSIVLVLLYLLINLILFICFTFNLLPENINEFLLKYLPTGMIPTHKGLTGFFRIFVWFLCLWGICPIISFCMDNLSMYREGAKIDSDWKTKLINGFLPTIVFTIIPLFLIGILYLLCFVMNIELWDKYAKTFSIISGIILFLSIVCCIGGNNNDNEMVCLFVPRSFFK